MPQYVFKGPLNPHIDYTEAITYTKSDGSVDTVGIGGTIDVSEAKANELKAQYALERVGGSAPAPATDKTVNETK